LEAGVPQQFLEGIKSVFFDAVGTLLHPARPVIETYGLIAQRHGMEIDQSQEYHDSQAEWKTSEEREADRWRQIVCEALLESPNRDACFADLWEWYRHPKAWTAHPQTDSVLKELTRRGLTVGMASNFDARLAAIVEAIPELKLLSVRCVISSVVGWRKPSRRFFDEVIQLAGCRAEQILFVGDDVRNDFEGARDSGIRAVLLDPTGKSEVRERIGTLVEVLEQ
jgi:putative hydrolase of the HAD superfamily